MMTHLINYHVKFNGCIVHIDEIFIGDKWIYSKGKIPKCKPQYKFGIIKNSPVVG